MFTPILGKDEPNLTHIFQMRWFNHQLGSYVGFALLFHRFANRLHVFYIRFIPQVQRHPNLVPSFQRLDEEQQDLILNNLKAPQNSGDLENHLLLISINFTPKTSHSCQKKWYTRFSREAFV